MAKDDRVLTMLAMWALAHESADEAWKAAVARGTEGGEGGSADADPSDVLAAIVNRRKDELKDSLLSGGDDDDQQSVLALLEEIRFEISALRGRLESIESTLDTRIKPAD